MAEIAGLEPHTSYAVRVRALTYQGKEGKEEGAFTTLVMPSDVFFYYKRKMNCCLDILGLLGG